MLSRCCVRRIPSSYSVNNLRCLSQSKYPSFSTEDKVNEYKMFPYAGAVSLILNESPNFPPPKEHNVELNSFFSGSKRAIESISRHISKRDFSALSTLVSADCMNKLRIRVFEEMDPGEIKRIHINSADIFFQYIQHIKVEQNSTRIHLVAFSLPRLAESRAICRKMKSYQDTLYNKASRTDGVLRREDMNAAEFRKVKDEFDDLNIDVLARDGSIIVSSLTFERTNGGEWTVSSFAVSDSRDIWSFPRRMIWKGRVHISVNFNMDFTKVLRWDYIIDVIVFIIFVYLQILALTLGAKVEKEAERRRALGLETRW